MRHIIRIPRLLLDKGERDFPNELPLRKAKLAREATEKIQAAHDRWELRRL